MSKNMKILVACLLAWYVYSVCAMTVLICTNNDLRNTLETERVAVRKLSNHKGSLQNQLNLANDEVAKLMPLLDTDSYSELYVTLESLVPMTWETLEGERFRAEFLVTHYILVEHIQEYRLIVVDNPYQSKDGVKYLIIDCLECEP